MNRLIPSVFAILVVAVASVSTLAQAPPTTAPAAVTSAPRVEIFPFASVSSQPAQTDWIGRGIQESLQSEVARTGATLLIPVHSPAPTDDAVTVARQNKADLAVIGTYQVVGDDVRVNGHVVDAASSATVGSFSATGPQKSLFNLEDALGEQLRRLLPAAPTSEQAASSQPQAAPQQPTVVYQASQPIYTPPPAVNNYYTTTPDYEYYDPGYYGYVSPYPFGFYGGVGIYGGGIYRGGFHGPIAHGGFVGRGGFAGRGGFVGHGGFGGGFHGGGGRR